MLSRGPELTNNCEGASETAQSILGWCTHLEESLKFEGACTPQDYVHNFKILKLNPYIWNNCTDALGESSPLDTSFFLQQLQFPTADLKNAYCQASPICGPNMANIASNLIDCVSIEPMINYYQVAAKWANESQILERCTFGVTCMEKLSNMGLMDVPTHICDGLESHLDYSDIACTVEQYGQLMRYFGGFDTLPSPRIMWDNCSKAMNESQIIAGAMFDKLRGDANADKRNVFCSPCNSCIANVAQIAENLPDCDISMERGKKGFNSKR